MFEGAVKKLLQTYLRDYLEVDEGGLEKIAVSLWSGSLDIENLDIKRDALEKLLGVELVAEQARVRKLSISIPWSALASKPVIIRLEGISLLAKPSGKPTNVKAKTIADINAEKLERVKQLEDLEASSSASAEEKANGSSSSESFWEKLGIKILDNLQLVLQDINIRFEEPSRMGGLRIGRIALVSTNTRWEEAFVVDAKQLHKVAKITDLELYLATSKDDLNQQFFKQHQIVARLALHRASPEAGAKIRSVNLSVDLGDCDLSLSRTQVLALSMGAAGPVKPSSPRQRWGRAISAVLKRNRKNKKELQRSMWVLVRRSKYVSLFKRRLQATKQWLPDLSEEEEANLKRLEEHENMRFVDIVHLRKVAYSEVRLESGDPAVDVLARRKAKSSTAKNSKQEEKSGGWISSWWHGTSKKDKQAPSKDEEESSGVAKKIQVTEEDRAQLFSTIGFDPSQAIDSTTDVNTIQFTIDTQIPKTTIKLMTHASHSAFATTHVGRIGATLEFQKKIQALSLTARSLTIDHHDAPTNGYQQIVAPRDLHLTAPLVSVAMSRKEMEDPLQVDVSLKQELVVVHSKHFVETVLAEFTPPVSDRNESTRKSKYPTTLLKKSDKVSLGSQEEEEGEEEDKDYSDIDEDGGSMWDAYLAAYSQSTVEGAWDENFVPKVSVTFKAFTFVLPQDCTDRSSPCATLDLGTFKIGQQANVNTWVFSATGLSASLKSNGSLDAENVQTSTILTDVKVDAAVVICSDAEDLSKPRVNVNVTMPGFHVKASAADGHNAVAILGGNFPYKQPSDLAEPKSPSKLTSKPSNASISYSEDPTFQRKNLTSSSNAAAIARMATRVALRVHGEIAAISVQLDSNRTKVLAEWTGLKLNYQARTYDSEIEFSTTSIRLHDSIAEKDLIYKEGQEDLMRVVVRTTQPHLSPLYQGVAMSVRAQVGSIGVLIPRTFVHGVLATIQDELPSSAADVQAPVDTSLNIDSPIATSTSEGGNEFLFDAELLTIRLAEDAETTIAILECGDGHVCIRDEVMSAKLGTLVFDKGEKERHILEIQSSENDAEYLSLKWTPDSGYVLETDPFHFKIDQAVCESLLKFATPESISRYNSMSSHQIEDAGARDSQTAAKPPKQTDGSSKNSSFELKLRNPLSPFVLEFMFVDESSCSLQIDGVVVRESVIRVNNASILVNSSEPVVSIDRFAYTAEAIEIEALRLTVSPMSRDLTLGALKQVQYLTDTLGIQGSGNGTKVPPPSPEQGAKLPDIKLNSFELETRDRDNANPVAFRIERVMFSQQKLSVYSFSMLDVDGDGQHYLTTVAPEDKDTENLLLASLDPEHISMEVFRSWSFNLTPKSYAVIMSLVDLAEKMNALLPSSNAEETQEPGDDKSVAPSSSHVSKKAVESESSFTFSCAGAKVLLCGHGIDDDPLELGIKSAHAAMGKDGSKVEINGLDIFDTLKCSLSGRVAVENQQTKCSLRFSEEETTIKVTSELLARLQSSMAVITGSRKRPGLEVPVYRVEPGAMVKQPSEISTVHSSSASSGGIEVDFTTKLFCVEFCTGGTDQPGNAALCFASCNFLDLALNFSPSRGTFSFRTPEIHLQSPFESLGNAKSSTVLKVTDCDITLDSQGHDTNLKVSIAQVLGRYNGGLISQCVAFQDALASLDPDQKLDDLPSEPEPSSVSASHPVQASKLFVHVEVRKVIGLVVDHERFKSKQKIKAIRLDGGFLCLVESTTSKTSKDNVLNVNLTKVSCALAEQDVTDIFSNPSNSVAMISDSGAVLKVSKNFDVNTGNAFLTTVSIFIENIEMSCALPVIPELARIIAFNAPSEVENAKESKILPAKLSKSSKGRSKRVILEKSSEPALGKLQLTISLDSFRLTVLGRAVPFLAFRTKRTSTVDGEISANTGDSPSAPSSASTSAFKGNLQLRDVTIRCFNSYNLNWEPLLEPCELSCDLETIPSADQKKGVKLAFRSSSSTRVNLHPEHIQTCIFAMDEWNATFGEASSFTKFALETSKSGGEPLGEYHFPLMGRFAVSVSNLSTDTVVLEGRTIRPDQRNEVLYCSSLHVDISGRLFSREVLLADGNVEVIDAPFLAVYVAQEHEHRFNVVFASTSTIINSCDFPLNVAAVAMNSDESKDVHVLVPESSVYVPSAIAERFSASFRSNDSEGWQNREIRNKAKARHDGSRNVEEYIELAESNRALSLSIDKLSSFPLTKLKLGPISVITNTLPEALSVKLFRRVGEDEILESEHKLEPDSKVCVYPLSPKDVYVKASFVTAPSTVTGESFPLIRGHGTYSYVLKDVSKNQKHVISYRARSGEISFLAKYWMVNRTGIDLAFGIKGSRLFLDEERARGPRRVEEETWENQRQAGDGSWKDEMLPGDRFSWSDRNGHCSEPRTKESLSLPESGSWKWDGSWTLDDGSQNTLEVDPDGWMYSTSFLASKWTGAPEFNHNVRRRRWVRTRVQELGAGSDHTGKDMAIPWGNDEIQVAVKADLLSPWSAPIALNVASGTTTVLSLQRGAGKSFFELVMAVQSHPDILGTLVCTFAPRLVLLNRLPDGLQVRCFQANVAHAPIQVGSNDMKTLFWHEPTQQAQLQFQLGKLDWQSPRSAPFPVTNLIETCIQVADRRVRVECKRCNTNSGTMMVVLSEDDTVAPMYKIQNISMDRIEFWQKGSEGVPQVVGPYSSKPFAWSSASGQLEVCMRVMGSSNTEVVSVDFSNLGLERRIVLPSQQLEGALGGGAPDTPLEEGNQVLLLSQSGTSKVRLTAQPTEKAGSVLDGTAGWHARLSSTEACAITFTKIAGSPGSALCFGDTVSAKCTSSDGQVRVLSVDPDTLHLQWIVAPSQKKDADHDPSQGKGQGEDQHQDHDSHLEDVGDESSVAEYGFVLAGSGALAENNSPVRQDRDSLALSYDGSYVTTLGHQSNKLGLSESRDKATWFTGVQLSSMTSLPYRTAFINVDIFEKSRVVRISDTSLSVSDELHEAHSSSAHKQDVVRLSLSFELDNFGVSLIQTAKRDHPFELGFLLADLKFSMLDTLETRAFDVKVNSLRLDHGLLSSRSQNVLHKGKTDAGNVPMVRLQMTEKHTQLNVVYLERLVVSWAPISVHLDDDVIEQFSSFGQQLGAATAVADSDARMPWKQSLSEMCSASIGTDSSEQTAYHLREMQLGEIQLKVSYFHSQIATVRGAPIELDSFEYNKVTARLPKLVEEVSVFYKTQVQRRVLVILGYLLPGNPGELISAIGGKDASVGNFFKGAVRSVASIGTLGGATLASVDSDFRQKRVQDARTESLGQGLAQGGQHIARGLVGGVRGLVDKPRQGAEKDGVAGALKGFGSGVMGFFTKPVAGIASAVGSTSKGIIAETKSKEELDAERRDSITARPMRFLRKSPRSCVLEDFDTLESIVLRKALKLSSAPSHGESVPEAAYVVSFFFHRLSVFLLHTHECVALGHFKAGSEHSVKAVDTSRLDHCVQAAAESLEKTTRVQILWKQNILLDSTQAVEQTVRFWTVNLGVKYLSQCESRLRKAMTCAPPPMLGPKLKAVSVSLGSSFGVSHPPQENARALHAAFRATRGDVQLRDVLLGSGACSTLPLTALCVTRAYLHGMSPESLNDALQAQDAVEQALLGFILEFAPAN